MKFDYKPQNVCSSGMTIELSDDGIIEKVVVRRGCPGNTLGISQLVVGMRAQDVIERFRGVRCGLKKTSCPDQLADALEQALSQLPVNV